MRQPPLALTFLAGFYFVVSALAGEVSGLSPADAAGAMTVPDGFHVTLFAGEPDIVQPAGFEFDDRGRLWVAEFKSYPNWKPTGTDRILIFEDKDGDGHFDSVKTFWGKGNYLSGLTLGFGGVWVCCAPNLLFIPMKDGTDVPSGEPQVILDGWGITGKHNVINSLTWGPDGWLYGCNGITAPSLVGKPGTPEAQRIKFDCGIWRYHPTKKVFEVVLNGTTNPWGIDYDDWGQMFICNTVIGHLWHVIPGMHTERMFGEDVNPFTYGLIQMCADHIHWAGGSWQGSRGGTGPHDAAGGGHSHCGAMIYSGDNWPDRYRNTFFTINTHGNRINNDILRRRGSGYVAQHGKDFLFANDLLFRGTAIKSGPDGTVMMSDWNQGGECHSGDLTTTGRLYRVSYGKPTPYSGDVSKLPDDELVKLQLHKNDWFVRRARRIMQERAAAGTLKPETAPALRKMYDENPDITRKLRALWALNAIGAAPEEFLLKQLDHEDDNIRSWAVRLLADFGSPSDVVVQKFAAMAKDDPSAMVRLHLASAVQKLPIDKTDEARPISRETVLQNLLAHAQDAADHNLPLMYWYALEPIIPLHPLRAPLLGLRGQIPLVREYAARRAAELSPESGLEVLDFAVSDCEKARTSGADTNSLAQLQARQIDVLKGIATALKGQRGVKAPPRWKALSQYIEASSNSDVRKLGLKVALIFGDTSALALAKYRALASDEKASIPDRQDAVAALVEARDDAAPAILRALLAFPELRGTAIRALSVFADEQTAGAILKIYPALSLAERSDAIYTLGSRPAYVKELLAAIQNGSVPKQDLNAFTIRYLETAGVPEFDAWVKTNWGGTRQSPVEIQERIGKFTKIVKSAGPQASDLHRGQIAFKKTCSNCHTLFGEGGKVGPDLTGSGRKNLDYLMLNVIDPNAIVPFDYQLTVVKTKDGRTISGLERNVREKAFDLITPNEVVTVPKSDVASKRRIETSMMPEGILDTLSEQEVIDLVAFLQSDGVK